MKVKTYSVTSSNFRYGDLDSEETIHFAKKDTRDIFFQKKLDYLRNYDFYEEVKENDDTQTFTSEKWVYVFIKRDSEITIIEDIVDGKLIS